MHIFRDAFLGANVVYFKGVCVQGVPAGVQVHECGVHVWCLCASSLPLCNRKCRHIKEELVDFVCSRLVVKVPRCNMGP